MVVVVVERAALAQQQEDLLMALLPVVEALGPVLAQEPDSVLKVIVVVVAAP
jgi:hypothetical protein